MMLIVILLDQCAYDIHQGCKWVRLIAANLINKLIEDADKLIIFRLNARNEQNRRDMGPRLCCCS